MRRSAWLLGLAVATGCAQGQTGLRDPLDGRATPAETIGAEPTSRKAPGTEVGASTSDSMVGRAGGSSQVEGSKAAASGPGAKDLPAALVGNASTNGPARPAETAAGDAESAELDAIAASGRPVTLHDAIALAFRHQPRLRAEIEAIAQAKGRQEIVGSTFLPTAGVSGSVGGYEVNAGGIPVTSGLKVPAGFTFLPSTGVLPVGFHINSGYELVDFRLQWLITDFGRRLGRFEQAKLSVEVAQLQTDRAFQTVSNEVSVAYYDVLKSQALRLTAQDANRRADEQLEDARKLESEGVVERETVLRAEVLRAEARQQLHTAIEAEFVASAELNLAIGLKCGEPLRVIEPAGLPSFDLTLADCLQAAIRERREFRVAKRAVEISQSGTRVARAEFAPKVTTGANLLNIKQNTPSAYGDVALGFIRVDWELFEGGRRIAERRVADSRLREAMAQAESIADHIAFQVNEAYRRMAAARFGIEDARPAVAQAGENYRLVGIRAREGNATPTEITDAQASLTRAQQSYQNAIYAYLTAVARLEYVMGNGPTPVSLANCKP